MVLEHRSVAKIQQQPEKVKNRVNDQPSISAALGMQQALLIDELKGIKTFDLVTKGANMLEKVVWGVVFIAGMLWAAYFMVNEVKSWQVHPTIVSNKIVKLSDIPNPAITFCSESSTKFAIAERLGNYLDPNRGLPKEFLDIREILLKYTRMNAQKFSDCGSNGCKVIYYCE